MFKFITNISIICAVLLCTSIQSKEVPSLKGRVNDYAAILNKKTIQDLENILKKHEKQTSNQIVILTITSLEGEILEQYSLKVAQTWKLGQDNHNNGVLLLISKQDRKLRIEVGYGLEATLTDASCKQIIDNIIVPEFKKGDFNSGTTRGILAITKVIKGEFKPKDLKNPLTAGAVLGFIFMVAIFILVSAIVLAFYYFMLKLIIFGKGWQAWVYFIISGWILAWPLVLVGFLWIDKTYGGLAGLGVGLFLLGGLRIFFQLTNKGIAIADKYGLRTSVENYSSGSYSSTGYSGGSGSFSGGGGSFGGGGASGSW